jgi:hypothetical protein
MTIKTVWVAALIGTFFATSSAPAADGKLSNWGPFSFGQSAEQIRSLVPGAGAVVPDANDADISFLPIQSMKFEFVTGSLTVRFYNDRAFEFSFYALDAHEPFVPKAQANAAPEAKIRTWCPSVFSHMLDLFAGQYGKPDEILRPEFGRAVLSGPNPILASSARWWFSDGSRLVILSSQTDGPPFMCAEFISMRSAKYSKAYVPEILSTPK